MALLLVGFGFLVLLGRPRGAVTEARALPPGAPSSEVVSPPVNGGLVFVAPDLVPLAPSGSSDPVANIGSLVGTVSAQQAAELAAASARISGAEGNPIVAPVVVPSGGFLPVVRL